MGKRLGRKRLFALNKQGETQARTMGLGVAAAIGRQTRLRSGAELISELTIDLGATGSDGTLHSFATTGTGAGAVKAIGMSSSTGTHQNAQLLQVNFSSTATDGNGIITSGELVCVETPLDGEDHIGLWYASNASGSGNDMHLGGVELVAAADQVLGKDGTFDVDVDLDDKYLYLVTSGSDDANYRAGKFVVRLYGFEQFADV
jgi:hypothetical protein